MIAVVHTHILTIHIYIHAHREIHVVIINNNKDNNIIKWC